MVAVPLTEAPRQNPHAAELIEFPRLQPVAKELFTFPECTFTPVSLTIKPGMKFERWLELGKALRAAAKGVQFWVGDWINYGEHEYGEMYSQALEATGRSLSTLQNWVYVADKIKSSRRRELDCVDFTTHAEVASLPPDEQERILAKAESEGLTVKQTRREVHKAQRRMGKKKSEIEVLREPEVQEWLSDLHKAIVPFVDRVPLTAPFLRSMVRSFLGVIEQQSERTVESDCDAIKEFFDAAERGTDDDIFKWLLSRFYFIRDPELDERLEYMVDHKMLRKEKQGGRKEGQKGDLPDIYMLARETVFD